MRAVKHSTSKDTNAKDWSSVDGESKMRWLATMRTKPDSTRMEKANGSGPVVKRVTQAYIRRDRGWIPQRVRISGRLRREAAAQITGSHT